MIEEIVLTLSRLSCNGCVRNVTRALQMLPGVEVQRTNTATKTVQVRYPAEQISLETIKATLAEANYPVVVSHSLHDTQQR